MMRKETQLCLTFSVLIGLLIATVLLSFLDLGRASVWVALIIAVTKTLLIAIIFMDLRESYTLIRIAACTGFVWLVFLLLITLSDYRTRGWKEPGHHPALTIERVETFDQVDVRGRDTT